MTTLTDPDGIVTVLPTVGDPPADVWCDRCDRPTYAYVDGVPLCHHHMLDTYWKARSPSWSGSPDRRAR